MTHDVSHCFNYKKGKCPDTCYRAQVTADLDNRPDLIGVPLTFTEFEHTSECPLNSLYVPENEENNEDS